MNTEALNRATEITNGWYRRAGERDQFQFRSTGHLPERVRDEIAAGIATIPYGVEAYDL